MDIILYIIIFIIGALLGSFYARTIQRISKQKKVFSVKSHCSKCGEKLKISEKIPIISYILQKGKCKHCAKKIDKKYIILEIVTGILFVLTALGLEINIYRLNIVNIISFIFIALYISYIILTITLDKQNRDTSASLVAFGTIISLMYIVYLWITEETSIYINVIYLAILAALLLLNIITAWKKARGSYFIDLLTTLLIMQIFTREMVCILTVIATLVSIALYIIMSKIKLRNKTKITSRINTIFIMGTLNLIIFLGLIYAMK